MSDAINLCTRYLDGSTINLEEHLRETLGEPIKLPEAISSLLEEHWANSDEVEPNLLSLFELMTGSEYQQVWRDNTYNTENDLDSFAVVTVYADTSCPDWCWRRDVFVAVEIGAGGDPRYSSYSPARIYRLDDGCIGDTGFLEWRLGYWCEPISDRYDEALIDSINDRLGCGYSSYPYGELESFLESVPIWSESRKAFVGKLEGIPFPVRILPQPPAY
jgi:hypothetical protein